MSSTKTIIRFRCLGCRAIFIAEGSSIGHRTTCPYCTQAIFVPSINNVFRENRVKQITAQNRAKLDRDYLRLMTQRHFYYLMFLISLGIGVVFTSAILILLCSGWPSNGIWLFLWGALATVVACTCLARAKGRSLLWGFSGLAGLLGITVLMCLGDVRQDRIAGITKALTYRPLGGSFREFPRTVVLT